MSKEAKAHAGTQLPEPYGMKWLNKRTGATGVYFEDPRKFGINTEHPDYEWAPVYSADQMRAALAATEQHHVPTVVDINAQDWAGMNGATAYQLIDRHGEDWSHIGRLMEAWRTANTPQIKDPGHA